MEKGEGNFLDLMDKTAGEMIHVFLDFNAVIMNLGFVSPEKRKELLDSIHEGICELQETLEVRGSERQQIPATGQTIFRQQKAVTDALFPCKMLSTMDAEQGYDPLLKIEQCRKWAGEGK